MQKSRSKPSSVRTQHSTKAGIKSHTPHHARKIKSRHTAPHTQGKRHYSPPTLDSIGKSKPTRDGVRLVLLGAPGAGKGSFSKYISHYFDIPMISTGDLIRNEIKQGTERGKACEDIIKRGELIDDTLVFSMLQHRVTQPDAQNGYILDGFPRNYEQVVSLDKATKIDGLFKPPNHALLVELDYDVAVTKAESRRVCYDCGKGYNLANINNGKMVMPPLLPKIDGQCDDCDGQLVQRSDDTRPVIEARLQLYQRNADPIIAHYKQAGILSRWNIIRGMEDAPDLIKMMDEKVHQATPEQQHASI